LVGYPPFCSEVHADTYRKIMNWKDTLRFPDDCHISSSARDLIERLICHHSQRLGVHGVEEIEAHPFFAGIDWKNLRSQKAPFIPELSSPTDTRYFEEYEEIEDPHSIASDVDADVGPIDRSASPSVVNVGSSITKKAAIKPSDIPWIGYTYRSFDAVKARWGSLDFGSFKIEDLPGTGGMIAESAS